MPWRYEVVSRDAATIGRRAQNGTAIASGRGGITIPEVMAMTDKLPPAVRRALNDAAHEWAPSWAAAALFHGCSEQVVIEMIERADREEARKRLLGLLRGEG